MRRTPSTFKALSAMSASRAFSNGTSSVTEFICVKKRERLLFPGIEL
jgi:hypothetical protein